MGSDREDGHGEISVLLKTEYYLKHKEVLDNFMMKGTSRLSGGSTKADMITFIGWDPMGGIVKIKDDPAFVAYLRLTGGL